MFIFLDTETTGTGPDNRTCQIAFKSEVGPTVNELFNPGMPIHPKGFGSRFIRQNLEKSNPLPEVPPL